MSDELGKADGPFDVKAVSALVKLMKEFDLSEIDLHEGTNRLRLRRGGPAPAIPAPLPASPVPFGPTPILSSTPVAAVAPPVPTKPLLEVKSELVGSFYAKPAPDKDDYVKVGSRVSPDTVMCKVEAMKIFNDITAKCSGTVVEICVQNGEFVEFEQVLFRIDPS